MAAEVAAWFTDPERVFFGRGTMINYILRRLLLMIPTLIGITLMVFMLIALSPGGIGAGALAAGGGGAMQSSNAIAITRAKLEDRYGLNEPAPVQYLRWLGRISPIKFGARDQVNPSGDLVIRPRPIPEPALWHWFAAELPTPKKIDGAETETRFPKGDPEAHRAAFRTVEREYSDARSRFTADDAMLRDAIKRYIESTRPREEWSRYLDKEKIRVSRIARLTPDKSHPVYAEVQQLAGEAIKSWGAASNAREELIAGLNTKPYPQVGYWIIPGAVSITWPDLGTAFGTGRSVIDMIKTHLPVTLMLNLLAFPIIYMIAIPSGMLAAVRRGSWADVGLGGLYIAMYSVPVVLAGVLALGFLATPEYFNLFPAAGLHDKASDSFTFLPSRSGAGGAGGEYSRGYLLDMLMHVVLPVACMVYGGFAILSKQTRAAMLENLNADYVRTAKAKGVSNKDVIFVHVFRNSLLPLITIFVTIFPAMLAGSVVIERIFSIPGMGYMLIEAISQRDREIILANTTMIAIVNLLALLLADILYALVDPRITYK